MSIPRVRIAPSPTGNLHIGTARAALFNYLFAKNQGGVFVLRIEDTDLERSDKKYEQNIFDGLRWLGIDPDEGPEQGGPYAPYRQTERTEHYEKYIRQLLAEGKAFYCFHSEKELAEEKERMMVEKRAVLHVCEYRDMTHADAQARAAETPDFIIRFKTSAGRKIAFTDLIRGNIAFESDLIGDFSVAKHPAVPLYNFAVVADDYEMKITHVIRGEDHIANTPKQMLIAEALGFPMPEYAHLPLILGPDRSKLSKRHGATSVDEYRAQGYLPEALFNFMALLGWNPGGDREIFSKEELIQLFSLEKVQKSGAVFDSAKLDWMNGEYIRAKSVAELTDLCMPFFGEGASKKNRAYLEKVVALEQLRLKKLSEIGERADYFFKPPEYDKDMLRWKQMSDSDVLSSLTRAERVLLAIKSGTTEDEIEKAFFDEIAKGDRGSVLWPLRVALSGKKASPGPFEIMSILGREESLGRVQRAIQKVQ
ncbi:MAG: nondiscriminating glutamyl-tRNA synthetase [Parcubacteria group bacterium Greene0714_36]|nr:MAG: nondiscriminating glutamyl-tRNA synthetase [Parcubacteria group bacterium Greene0714_36]